MGRETLEEPPGESILEEIIEHVKGKAKKHKLPSSEAPILSKLKKKKKGKLEETLSVHDNEEVPLEEPNLPSIETSTTENPMKKKMKGKQLLLSTLVPKMPQVEKKRRLHKHSEIEQTKESSVVAEALMELSNSRRPLVEENYGSETQKTRIPTDDVNMSKVLSSS